MSVKIRLTRLGRKNTPFYRVVVIDSRSARDGKFIEKLGHYDPLVGKTKNWDIDIERAAYWLTVGAQPSETVASFLRKEGVFPREKAVAYLQKVALEKAASPVTASGEVVSNEPVAEA